MSIHEAAKNGSLEQVTRWLDEGTPVDRREQEPVGKIPSMLLDEGEEAVLKAGYSFCRTPLMVAALSGQGEIAALLLQRKASLKAKDAAGWTPWLLACRSGHRHIAEMLLAAGVDVKQKTSRRQGALHVAVENGQGLLLEWLLTLGLDVDAKDSRGETALFLAAGRADLPLLKALLQAGANPNLASKDQRFPLAAAIASLQRVKISNSEASSGKYSSVQWTDEGVFGWQPVAEDEVLPLVQLLLDAGALVNPEPSTFPPLIAAAQSGYARIVEQLLANGADPGARGILGDTALELARLLKKTDVVAVLEATAASESRPPSSFTSEEQPSRWGAEVAACFAEPAASLLALVSELAQELGGAQVAAAEENPAVFELLVAHDWDWPEPFEGVQSAWLKRGVFVFEPTAMSAEPHRLLLLPTSDRYQSLAVMGTSGVNYGIGPGYLMEWLENLEKRHPFALLAVGHNLLAGRFRNIEQDATGLAQEMYELCPDIVEQGTGSVQELASSLAEEGRFLLWWD